MDVSYHSVLDLIGRLPTLYASFHVVRQTFFSVERAGTETRAIRTAALLPRDTRTSTPCHCERL
jgi:hypothetical protein